MSMTLLEQTLAAAAEQLRTGDLTQAEKSYRAILEAVPDHVPSLFNLALIAHHAGRVEEAIAVFELNVEAYPAAFNTYDSLGEAYMTHGDTELAIRNYEKSLELNPENTNATDMLQRLRGETGGEN